MSSAMLSNVNNNYTMQRNGIPSDHCLVINDAIGSSVQVHVKEVRLLVYKILY